MSERIPLEAVDAINVIVLVDNFIDALLPSGEVAQRPRVAYDMWEREREQLITLRPGETARSSSRPAPSSICRHRAVRISTGRGSWSPRSASRAS